MADNVAITAGTGTTIAADDVGGVLHQRVKISQGADGVATDVSTAAPLQVTLANHGANATSVKVTQGAATVPTATTMQAGATASGNGTSLPVTGYAVAILNIVSSTPMSGGTTVNCEGSVDDTTWVALQAQNVSSNVIATTTTSDGDYRVNVAGYKSVRARISAYSAGNTTIIGYTIQATGPPTAVNENLALLGGTAVDTNSGSKSAGTLRVVLATDQPALTNRLLITTDVASTVLNGNKNVTTAGTRVTLASSTAAKQVIIRAKQTNTGLIYVGDTSVSSTTGHILLPGESVGLEIANLNTVNLDSSVNGEGVTYLGSV